MGKRILCILLALITTLAFVPVAFADEQGQYKEDDVSMKAFQSLYADGIFNPGSDVKVDTTVDERGILVSGKNAVLATKTISLGNMNFGSDKLQRIQLDAVAEKGVKTKLMVYLDGSSSPTATFIVPHQSKENIWTLQKNMNVDVASLGITGSHSVSISFCQYYSSGKPKDDGTCKIFLRSLQFVKQSIPVMNINIDESLGTIDAMNTSVEHTAQCYGDFTITVPSGYKCKYGNFTGGTFDLEYIKGRGNSTWNGYKKPYKIKLEKKSDLFNMGASKHWALIANDYDETLIRNNLTYSMGEDLGMPFTPQGVPIDVIMNGEYLGSYYLCENVRVEKERVDIDDLEDDSSDITGGYLLGTAAYGADPGAFVFKTKGGYEFNVNSPDSANGDFTKQNKYIENYMQRAENALMRKKDPETGKVENPFDFIDLDSAVEYYWIQELTGNGDFYCTGSTYCYKERGGKLCWGPLWDFDLAYFYGNGLGEDEYNGNEWKCQRGWFTLMLSFPEFNDALKKYWNEKLEPELNKVICDGGMIDQYSQDIIYSVANNNTSAKYYTGEPEVMDLDTDIPVKTTSDEMNSYYKKCDMLKKMLAKRVEWISSNLDTIGIPDVTFKFKNGSKTVLTTKIHAGTVAEAYPKDPVSPDSSKVFAGWFYNYIDDYGYEQRVKVEKDNLSLIRTAKEKGEGCTITATAEFMDKSEDLSAKKVYFERSKYRIGYDVSASQTYYIPFTTGSKYTDRESVKWKAEDSSIIEIYPRYSSIMLVPKKPGTTKLTATTKAGKKYSVTIEIVGGMNRNEWTEHAPESYAISKKSVTVAKGSLTQLKVINIQPKDYIEPEATYGQPYEWYSSDISVAEADYGVVTGNKVGSATIVLRQQGGNDMQFCKVTVVPRKAVISKTSKSGSSMSVKMKTKVSNTGGSKYQVAYRVKGTKDWKKTSTTKQSASVSVKAGKTYQVKARAIKSIDGKTYYGSWSSIKTVK